MSADRKMAVACQEQGDYAQAITHYQKALADDADVLSHYTGLVDLYEKTNQLDKAQAMLGRVPQRLRGEAQFSYYQAKLWRRAKKYEQALKLLQETLGAHEQFQHDMLSYIFNEIGVLYEKLGRFDEAYEAFLNGNLHVGKTNKFKEIQDKVNDYERMKGFRGLFKEPWLSSCTPPPKTSYPAPVFLFGFPRSGTTLAERILDAHPRVQALSEKGVVKSLMDSMSEKIGGLGFHMASLTKSDLEALQAEYYDLAREYVPVAGRQIILDKNPLNFRFLGHICRVFPRPKIILALRHPCDCIFSAFKQSFALNPATIHMLTLHDAVNYYKAVFDLLSYYRRVLDFDLLTVRYEDMIADPEKETRRMLDFMGLKWDDALMKYNQRNKDKYVSSASYHQVSRPIYHSSVYQWENYRAHMEPYLPALEPYIRNFGYGE